MAGSVVLQNCIPYNDDLTVVALLKSPHSMCWWCGGKGKRKMSKKTCLWLGFERGERLGDLQSRTGVAPEFSSVQGGIYALGKTHICSPPRLSGISPVLPLTQFQC